MKLIVLDCETGGLDPTKHAITEIAMLSVDPKGMKEINRWETLIKSYGDLEYEKDALEVTGISLEDINSGMDATKVVAIFIKFCEQLTPKGDRGKHKPIIVGHNVGFDIGFIKRLFEEAGKNLADYVNTTGTEIAHIDTQRLAMVKWYDMKSHKLGKCCERANVTIKNVHRAMADVMLTYQLLVVLLNEPQSSEKTDEKVVKKPINTFRKKFEF